MAEIEWEPRFNWHEFPGDEIEALRRLESAISGVLRQEEKFATALDLFKWAYANTAQLRQKNPPMSEEYRSSFRTHRWTILAAEHAALCVDNFRHSMYAVKDARGKIPTLVRKIPPKDIESVLNKFDEYFPFNKVVRDNTVHTVDHIYFKYERHHINDVLVSSSLRGQSLVMTADKQEVSLDITDETLGNLSSLRLELFKAFRNAAAR